MRGNTRDILYTVILIMAVAVITYGFYSFMGYIAAFIYGMLASAGICLCIYELFFASKDVKDKYKRK